MADKTERRVHLDHLLPRQSLRYTRPENLGMFPIRPKEALGDKLAYSDLDKESNLVLSLYKPDFQRETSAWKPSDCADLLKSIVNGLIVPSLILWRSEDTGLVYVLDGAHRVSVVKAWMLDDWGDKAPPDYYERHERSGEIQEAANEARWCIMKLARLRVTDKPASSTETPQ